MGNCLKQQSSTNYATDDEDWDLSSSKVDCAAKSNDASAKTTTEVKIKITKKQLEELLSKVDMRELRVEQVLAQLMNHSNGYKSLQRSWRPALQSIPEMD
ncbi:protein expression protein [Trifolium repens]|jgi:membrane-bound ClpP family serine protease|nr:protein expression protein [Trifolium repens]